MKIEYGPLNLKKDDHRFYRWPKLYVYKYKIVNSILKTHYKELMRMAKMINFDEYNTGVIAHKDKEKFEALVAKIEKSSDKRCETSHQKAIEAKKVSKSKKDQLESCKHEDLGSLGYRHGERVKCPFCGKMCEVW
jgi:hypothetical protein